MNNIFSKLAYKVRCTLNSGNEKKKEESLRKAILSYYSNREIDDREIAEAVSYLKSNRLENRLIPCAKAINCRQKKEWAFNKELGIPYVKHEGKDLYFVERETAKTLKNKYLFLLEEQSSMSPHLYVTPDFNVKEGDVLYDVGSAEGIFALSNIEKARHVVLFEADKSWLKVLEATFSPWKDKVTIVPKYVSDIDDDNNISIDSFIKMYGEHLLPDFVKMDIEGAEMRALKGMADCINRKKFKLAITTYHYQKDYNEISAFLAEAGFIQEASKGVTLVGLDELKPPYFRKALIRAYKGV